MSNIGFRILPLVRRPDPRVVQQFRSIATPHISDNMNRSTGASAALRPYHKYCKLVGVALTVKTRAGDNLMVHKAMELAQPGDVIVVDAGGETSQAIIGELMQKYAIAHGIAGFVIDGAIRDLAALAADEFPVFARGVTHRGPYKDGPGEINVPVSVGGMVVNPGDIIVGDENGVLTVSQDEAERVIEMAMKKSADEAATLKDIAAGTANKDWIDRTLKQRGCSL
jgi:RraA family protein